MHPLTRIAVTALFLTSAVSAAIVSSGEAKEFDARKRINGRGVEGYFPKESAETRQDRDAQAAMTSAQGAEPTGTPPPPADPPFTLGLHFSAAKQQEPGQTPPEGLEPQRPASSEVRTTRSTDPGASKRLSRSEKRVVTTRHPERRAAKAGQEHERKVSKPAQAQITKPDAKSSSSADPAPASPAANESTPETTTDRYKRLAEALVAKARALASGLISSVSEPLPPPKVEQVLVADDYLTGIKTFAYSSGSLNEERFSPNAMEGLAAETQPTGPR
jgi:hypothetical protein